MTEENTLMTARQVMEAFRISSITLWRWESNVELGFPQPLRIRRRKYYRRADIETFIQRQQQAA